MTKKKLSRIALNSFLAIVVALCLLMLLGQFFPWIDSEQIERKEKLIEPYLRHQAKTIAVAYSIDKGIVSDPAYVKQFQDHWNHDMRIKVKDNILCLTSAGPDGKFETKDDIIIEERIPK